MKELSFEINPSLYQGDIDKVKKYLNGYDKAIKIYEGSYTADWLLGDVHSDVWIIKTNKTIINDDGTVRYAKKRRWDRVLPDGSRLTDKKNKKFREFIQKVTFILFESPVISNRSSINTLYGDGHQHMLIIAWLFLSKTFLNPNKYYLSSITHDRLVDMVTALCDGGAFGLLQTGERILEAYSNLSGNKIDCNNIFDICDSDCLKIIAFFKSNGLFDKNSRGMVVINRPRLSEMMGIGEAEVHGHKAILFLRQFEPEVKSINEKVLMPTRLRTEFPTHRTPLVKEIANKKFSSSYVLQIIGHIESWIKLKSLFPSEIPDPQIFRFNELRKLALNNGASGNTTPWIPFDITMTLLDKSIRFIVEYGEDITDFFELCLLEFLHKKPSIPGRPNVSSYELGNNDSASGLFARKYFISENAPESLKEINISGFGQSVMPGCAQDDSDFNKFERLRNEPSMTELLYVLHGACTIVIAGLKPIRINEFTSIKYDCLYYKEGDGYWLEHEIEKAGLKGDLPVDQKPVPLIVAKSIKLLQRYNDIAKNIYPDKDSRLSKFLFYGIHRGWFGSTGVLDAEGVGHCIEAFTDYINLELDEYGRRWYVNIHELRKSFLLNFFWMFKFSSLDACRWMAGHKDVEHVFKYIEANMPGEEMTELEAEYASQQLRLFSDDKGFADLENIEDLYKDVCRHFNVKSITELSDHELNDWIEYAIEGGCYSIEVYEIESIDGKFNSRVAIKVNQVK